MKLNLKFINYVVVTLLLSALPLVQGSSGKTIAQALKSQPIQTRSTSQEREIADLIKQLKGSDLERCHSIAKILSKIGDPAIPQLLPLLSDPDKMCESEVV